MRCGFNGSTQHFNRMRPANYTDLYCGAAVKADLHASRSKTGGRMTELRTKLPFLRSRLRADILEICSFFPHVFFAWPHKHFQMMYRFQF